MSHNPRYYYTLPTEAPQRSRSGSRRPPLTPSTVSSPCLTTLIPTTSRRDSGVSGSPTKASVLLAKVASSPTTPRGETPPGSPMLSPVSRVHSLSGSTYSSERPAMSRTESDRYVRQYRQQGKHIALPSDHGSTGLTSLQMATSASLTLRSSARARARIHMISTTTTLLSRLEERIRKSQGLQKMKESFDTTPNVRILSPRQYSHIIHGR
jgi:hypothetical protein